MATTTTGFQQLGQNTAGSFYAITREFPLGGWVEAGPAIFAMACVAQFHNKQLVIEYDNYYPERPIGDTSRQADSCVSGRNLAGRCRLYTAPVNT
jgi:hypothetical protein